MPRYFCIEWRVAMGIFDAPIDRLQRDHLEVRMPLEQDQHNILSDLLSVVTLVDSGTVLC